MKRLPIRPSSRTNAAVATFIDRPCSNGRVPIATCFRVGSTSAGRTDSRHDHAPSDQPARRADFVSHSNIRGTTDTRHVLEEPPRNEWAAAQCSDRLPRRHLPSLEWQCSIVMLRTKQHSMNYACHDPFPRLSSASNPYIEPVRPNVTDYRLLRTPSLCVTQHCESARVISAMLHLCALARRWQTRLRPR